MIATSITFFFKPVILICDGECHKAWGVNSRPEKQLSDDVDDTAYIPDHELGIAPDNPGTYEGGYPKPKVTGQRHNKWCARECERSCLVDPGEDFELPDFSVYSSNLG